MQAATILAIIATLLASAVLAASPCGRDGPACETASGTYRLALPDTPPPDGGWPALIFFHGAGGSGAGTLKMTGVVRSFTDAGYAVIAPDGMQRPNRGNRRGWYFHPQRLALRDELAFTREVIAAAPGHSIDPDRIVLSGFSIGGSLVWYLACRDHTLATAYAPVAGAFWRPHPEIEDCSGPVRMLHTHGWRDQTVPLEGRPLRSGQILQGDVFHGLEVLRALNGCTRLRADAFATDGAYWRRTWSSCTPGTALELALHPGGHSVPKGWADMTIEWLDRLGGETD